MLLLTIVVGLVGAALIIVLQKAANQIIKGIESLDERLCNIAEKLDSKE